MPTPIRIDWDLVEMWNPAVGRKKLGISGGTGGTVPVGGSAGQVLEKLSATNFDTGWTTIPSTLFTAQNKGAPFFIGASIARHPSGTGLILADATGMARKAIGLATVGAAFGFAEAVQLDGVFTMVDWTNVTGTANLQPLADYYLSVTPGMLATAAPATPGQVAQPVGFAISPTTLMVNPEIAILL